MLSPLGLFLQVAASGLVVDGAATAWKGARAKKWPTVQGRIIASRVRSEGYTVTGEGESGPTGMQLWEPRVRYEYEVQGRVYLGSRISFGGWRPTIGGASDVAESHPAGTTWTVSYDPEDPANSVLEPGTPGASVLELCLGLGLLIAGTLVSIGVWTP